MVRVEGPHHLQCPHNVGDEEVLGVGQEEPEPLRPGQSEVATCPHGILRWESGGPQPRQLVARSVQLVPHGGVLGVLTQVARVRYEPDLPGVPLSVQTVHSGGGVDTALGEQLKQ